MNDDKGNYEQIVSTAADAVDLFIPGIKAAVSELEQSHGPLTADMLRAYAIMQREMGEVSDAILDITRAISANASSAIVIPDEIKEAMLQHLGHEIAQVIAVGMYMLINLFGDRVQGENPIALVPGSDKMH